MAELKTPILEVNGLKQYFDVGGGQKVKAVDGVSFKIEKGDFCFLVGASGSRKIYTY